MECLKDKVAIVTGASSGIGQGIAEALANEGANIVINYLKSRQRAGMIVEHIRQSDNRAIAIQADMADKDAIDQLIRETLDEFGRIDIWINNAGADILTGTGAKAGIHEKLEQLIEVDLKGTMNACWSVLPVMQQQGYGVIVNMSWDLSTYGFAGIHPQIFAAAKAGVLGFTRSFAKTVGPEIRVNTVSPGWISTAFAEEYMQDNYYQARINEIPSGRFGLPADVAAAVIFLASDASSYVTGETIRVNGGLV